MRKLARQILIAIVFIALLTLIGCDTNEMTAQKTGSIEIVLANEVRARGFQPEISMEIHSYEISGTGPSDATIEPITLSEGTKVISGLIPGAWDITVKGYNEEGDEIGKGVLPVTIIAGHTLRKTILVEEIGGKGTFSLTLELPENQTTIKKVKLTLLQEDGESIGFTSAQPEEWSSVRPLVATVIDSGFHALSVQLYDENERLIWGETYTVRIVKGTQTEALITITEDDLATFGGLGLTIIDGMPVLFTVGLSATKDLVGLGEAVTFTATPNLSGGTYTYWWFVDGQQVEDETSKTLTLSDELAIGRHNVSVVAIRAEVMASASKIIIKTDDPPWIVNGVYLYPEEVQRVLVDLKRSELPTESGILFLAPHAIESPNSSELLPYSYQVTLSYRGDIIEDASLPEGTFAIFVPLEQVQSGTYRIEGSLLSQGIHDSYLRIELALAEEGPTICWLDNVITSGTSRCLQNIKTYGVAGLILSKLPVTGANGASLSSSDFYTPDGYIDSVEETVRGDEYEYKIWMKSDYNGTDPYKEFAIYATSSVKVDGRRPLADQLIASQMLRRLAIPNLQHGQYLDMEDNVMVDGYYLNYSKEFKLSIAEGYTFAGWAGEDGSFFLTHSTLTWTYKREFAEENTIPLPIIVANDTPTLNACYFDRWQYHDEQLSFGVDSPLGEETLKMVFSEPVQSNKGTAISADNFTITGATITSVTISGNTVEATIKDFQEGPFSFSLKNIVTKADGTPIEGQTGVFSRIIEMDIDNDETYGSINDCAGLYLQEDRVHVTVTPKPNYRVTRLRNPYGYSSVNDSKPGKAVTFLATPGNNNPLGTKYTISPQYEYSE